MWLPKTDLDLHPRDYNGPRGREKLAIPGYKEDIVDFIEVSQVNSISNTATLNVKTIDQ